MPAFVRHELAHAYHDSTLSMGFGNLEIKAAYEMAKTSGKYDHVEVKDGEGRSRMNRAYAMTNPQEYFAESTEGFFSRNDFFPFTRSELTQHDPEMFDLQERLWGVGAKPRTHFELKAAEPSTGNDFSSQRRSKSPLKVQNA